MLTPKLFRREIIQHAKIAVKITPLCPHAPPSDMCGGCTFQDISYTDQLTAKTSALVALWGDMLPATIPAPVVIGSPDPLHYRTRMDFIASKGRFGLRRGGKFNYIIDLTTCHLVPTDAFDIAHGIWQQAIAAGVPDYNLRSHEGILRYIVVRRSPDNRYILALITAAPDDNAEAALTAIAEAALANPAIVGIHWLRNDSHADVSFGTPYKHWGAELLPMRVGPNTLHIGPNTFFQNNVHLLDDMLAHIAAAVPTGQHVADLYGGVGTIALHLAPTAQSVHCVESFAESIELCHANIRTNQRTNVTAEVADVAEFLRNTNRTFDTIVVDPPRVGLGADVCKEILRHRPQRLVYVSCNPLSQIEDAKILAEGYDMTSLVGYDMFPQTPHFETLAIFDRRS